jgi:SAM-dependent methyltransferase
VIDAPAGSTGRLLRAMSSGALGPLDWFAAPLRDARRVLDLCCGDGGLAGHLPQGRWLGIDPGRGPVRGVATAIPLRDNAVDAVALTLVIPHLHGLDAVFAEIRRVLVPGGTLALLVPSASVRSPAELRGARLLAPVRRVPWTNRSALDHTGWLLHAADFAVLGDDRVSFALPLPDAAAAQQLVTDLARSGLWPRGVPAVVLDDVVERLSGAAGSGRVLRMPLRRLVARR